MFDHLRIWTTWKQWEQKYRKASVADTKDLEMLGKTRDLLAKPDVDNVGAGRAAKGASPVASTKITVSQ